MDRLGRAKVHIFPVCASSAGACAVRKGFYLRLAQLDADKPADLLRQCRIGIAGEDLDVLAVRNHGVTLSLSVRNGTFF